MRILCKTLQAFGIVGFFIAISADIEDISTMTTVGMLAIFSLIVGLSGWKGEQYVEDHKVRDYTSHSDSRPWFLPR